MAPSPSGHAFHEAIRWLADEGLSTGTEIDGVHWFYPSQAMSRQAMAVFLHLLAGEPAADAPAFSDVPANHPFATAIGWLEDSGIAQGYSDGRFAPADPTTRQAMAADLYRYDQL